MSAPANTAFLAGTEVRYPVAFNLPSGATENHGLGTLFGVNASGEAVEPTAAAGAVAAKGVFVVVDAFEKEENAGFSRFRVVGAKGLVRLTPKTGDAPVAGDFGATVYADNDRTIAKTAGSLIPAGKLAGVEADGVWVTLA